MPSGDWSLDAVAGLTSWSPWWAPVAMVLGVGSGLLTWLVPPVGPPS
ncbi:hypothetical protein [Streptomyces sp. NPDC001750]